MKKYLLASAALFALSATAPALAADLGGRMYSKAAPMVAPAAVYNWTGFYIGGHVGGAFNDNSNVFGGAGGFTDGSGNGNNGRFLGGVQVGYDMQFSQNWVLGVEGQYSWLSGNNNNFVGTGFAFNSDRRELGSVTGRLGYTWGPAMLYFKGGYAYSDSRDTVNFAGAPITGFNRGSRDGYTVGGGLEYMIAQNWSAKVEYMYYDFDRNVSATFVPGPFLATGNFRDEEHVIKAGLNYRFNLGGPVVARY
jgi:outer membrane immunogenic protein